MDFGLITTRPCNNVAPPTDPRCNDPAFAAANPDICPITTELVIKPGVALTCALGSIQFKAFLVTNGIETDVTGLATFSSSDLNTVTIGSVSGNATGLQPGEVTISATYQGKTSHAELTILAGTTNCCGETTVAMMVLLDTSLSMSQGFNAAYSSKLSYAKAAAQRFIGEVNAQKDVVGLDTFNSDQTLDLSDLTSNTASVAALVPTIIQTQGDTAFYNALQEALAQLNAVQSDIKLLYLISDGLSTTGTDVDPTSPFALLSNFKNQGGIVMCLGVRAAGVGFATLSAFATGGFFINAYDAVAADALNFISGLKGYVCAGNCTPAGDVIAYKGTLNYAGFINWTVAPGYVDLQGNGFFDYLPGNGLYVDLISGFNDPAPFNGKLTSKTTFPVNAGDTYRLTVALAGNQIVDRPADTVRIQVFYLNNDVNQTPVYLLNQEVTISDYQQGFTNYPFTFVAPGSHDVYISIQQEDIPGVEFMAGVLLNEVKFQDLSTLVTLIDDTFDTENPVYVTPRCGRGTTYAFIPDLNAYGYAYGYNCYGIGCLTEPPSVQLPDPSPLSDIESGDAPPATTYTSTKTSCASCPTGFVNLFGCSTYSAIPGPCANIQTVNVDSGDIDFLFQYQFFSPQTAIGYQVSRKAGSTTSPPSFWTFDGSNDGVSWTNIDSQNSVTFAAGETKVFPVLNTNAYAYYRIKGVPDDGDPAVTLFQIFAPATTESQACASATAESTSSQSDADSRAQAAALLAAQAMLNCQLVFTSTQQYTARCPVGSLGQPVTKSATTESLISQSDADSKALAAATAAAQAALSCNQSNNTQRIVINDRGAGSGPAAATPFPSVKFVSGLVGLITKVTVQINGLSHTWPSDIIMVLRGPDGTTCAIMAHCGDGGFAVNNINITFDDTGPAMPANGQILAQTYRPSQYPVFADEPAPGPASPYGTTLSVFNGKDPNGSWSLWICDQTPNNAGSIASGFDLTITSA